MFIVNIDNSPVDVVHITSVPLYCYLVNSGLIPIGSIFRCPAFQNTEEFKELVEKFKKEVDNSESDSKI